VRAIAFFAAVAALAVAPAATAATRTAEPTHGTGNQLEALRFHDEGVACDACSKRLREALMKLDGVIAVDVDRARAELAVEFDGTRTTEAAVRGEVERHGFAAK
jgi:copper chaperone CopZ